jgi:hypothetical protein
MSLISGNKDKIFDRDEIGNVRKAQEETMTGREFYKICDLVFDKHEII